MSLDDWIAAGSIALAVVGLLFRRWTNVAIMEVTALSPVTYSFAYSQYAGFRRA